MSDIYAKQYAEAEFAEALKALREYAYPLSYAQLAKLADIIFDKAEEMDMPGNKYVVDAASMLKYQIDNWYVKPEQLSVYGRTE